MVTRRTLLTGLAAGALTGFLPQRLGQAAAATDPRAPVQPLALTPRISPRTLLGPGTQAQDLYLFNDTIFPIVRARRGTRLKVAVDNRLPVGTTVHWHGIRLPNPQDGVPGLTQDLIPANGGQFTYEVPLPDAGTYFFHPHCDETGQVGRGLAGVLIVEDEEKLPFQAEHVLVIKDWRLAPDGSFLPFLTEEGASKAGTFGTVRGVNGVGPAMLSAPAHADLRLRILNLDSTRTVQVGTGEAEGYIIAYDGHAVPPLDFETCDLGSSQRLDLHVRMPAEGQSVSIYDYRTGGDPFLLARIEATASNFRKRPFKPIALPPPNVPKADLRKAERFSLSLQQATDDAATVLDGLPPDDPLAKALVDQYCTGPRTFWAISQNSWPTGGTKPMPPPLLRLVAGRSYVISLTNPTQHLHPIHLHGHVFDVISASKSKRPRHYADTVLLAVRETAEIAFVAAPGNWVLHCHILDHMETGMMGYVSIA
ncbi:multicopper oxidase family protein [Roseixanthobacter glucoisosaccharinicivorans]|uniref:multicopper oxidase family protein n=1 Tax=Roseixanthobacter glucoisosaccharinicivorans TaxID=3119923 RepID=UPI00372C5982